jgi:hypothetical protein
VIFSQKYGQKFIFVCYFRAKADENTKRFPFVEIKYVKNEKSLRQRKRQTDRKSERDTNRLRGRQTAADKQRETQTEKKTGRKTHRQRG